MIRNVVQWGCALVALLVTPSVRAGVLDQQYQAPTGYGQAVSSFQSYTQTFTVGKTGKLDRFELQVSKQPGVFRPLRIEIRGVLDTGVPDPSPGALRFAMDASSNDFPATTTTSSFRGYDLGAAAFPVSTGEQLAFVLSTQSTDWFVWTGWNDNPYPGGHGAYRNTATVPDWSILPNDDSGFRTYVNVPEPTSAVGAMAAASAVACFMRRRRV